MSLNGLFMEGLESLIREWGAVGDRANVVVIVVVIISIVIINF